MINSGPVTIEEILFALRELGGEAQAVDIKKQVTKNRGGVPNRYSSARSFEETIQRMIEDHCPESANYSKTPYFKRVGRGRYKLI